jgi:hypothetical protein
MQAKEIEEQILGESSQNLKVRRRDDVVGERRAWNGWNRKKMASWRDGKGGMRQVGGV